MSVFNLQVYFQILQNKSFIETVRNTSTAAVQVRNFKQISDIFGAQ